MALAQVLFLRAREMMVRRFRAQTMVEYALIIASCAASSASVESRSTDTAVRKTTRS